MKKNQVTIIGNNVASLVAGTTLAEQGYQIYLINPLHNWGGHFGGVTFEDAQFDYGMTFFEFDSFQPTQSYDVLTYDPSVRNDSGRFTSLIKDYVEQLIVTKLVPKPKMLLKDILVNDLMITNDLTGLMTLSDEAKQAFKKDLSTIVANSDKSLHAAKKLKNNLFVINNFQAVSVANHGITFHNLFIEPFSKKVLFKSSSDFLALYHRAVWLPLYYPETLLSQFEIIPHILKTTQFHYPSQGYIGALVDALLMKAQNNSNITIYKKSVASLLLNNCYRTQCSDGSVFETNQLVWNLDLSSLLKAIGTNQQVINYQKASMNLCFIGVATEKVNVEFSTLFVLDENYLSYRITNQNVCAGSDLSLTKLVVEFNTDFALSMQIVNEAQIRARIEYELVKLNIIELKESVQYFYCKYVKNALMIPNQYNYDCFMLERVELLEKSPNIQLNGSASGFMSTSLNDQIIQGLQIAKALED